MICKLLKLQEPKATSDDAFNSGSGFKNSPGSEPPLVKKEGKEWWSMIRALHAEKRREREKFTSMEVLQYCLSRLLLPGCH
ncbi:unnamed protein product [Citrullus colocynthis]|uniref:Uncharacterized protein n=1 Tax=Citrullus colocynthis TaxID=252529 RepID=A0ABP0XQI9_9ROSI